MKLFDIFKKKKLAVEMNEQQPTVLENKKPEYAKIIPDIKRIRVDGVWKYVFFYRDFELTHKYRRIFRDSICGDMIFDSIEYIKSLLMEYFTFDGSLIYTRGVELPEKVKIFCNIHDGIEDIEQYYKKQKEYDDEVEEAKTYIGRYFLDKVSDDYYNLLKVKEVKTIYGMLDDIIVDCITVVDFKTEKDSNLVYCLDTKKIEITYDVREDLEEIKSYEEISKELYDEVENKFMKPFNEISGILKPFNAKD